MKLHAPAMWVFVLSLVIAVLAVVSVLTPIPLSLPQTQMADDRLRIG